MSRNPAIDVADMLATLRQEIGRTSGWEDLAVTAREVARFRMALDADARSSPATTADTAVPPTFFCPDPLVVAERLGVPMPRPFPNLLDGGTTWECPVPLEMGRAYRLQAEITDIQVKQGSRSTGVMYLTTVMISCVDDERTIVGRCRGISISYEGAAA